MFNRSYLQGHERHPHYFSELKLSLLEKSVSLSPEENGLVRIVRNLSDPNKFKIYLLLHQVEEMAVSDIKRTVGMSQSAVSHALSDLKKLGLIDCSRCGRLICYSLVDLGSENRFLSFFRMLKDEGGEKGGR